MLNIYLTCRQCTEHTENTEHTEHTLTMYFKCWPCTEHNEQILNILAMYWIYWPCTEHAENILNTLNIYWTYRPYTEGTKQYKHLPQNSLNSSGHPWGTNALLRDAGPSWLQWFPQLCEVGWMSFGWWIILDTWETVECEKPSNVAVLDTNWCAWHLLPYPVQWHLNILSCPFTRWMAHIHNPCLNYF